MKCDLDATATSSSPDFLLSDNGDAGSRPGQRGEDDQFGRAVGFGDRRRILLVLDVEAAADDLQDRLAGFARRNRNVFEKLLVAHGF